MIRHRASRIAIFNHKGGVGKTTLTFNLAMALGEMGKRILLVDSDPQSNLTSFFVEDNVIDKLLDTSDSEKGNTIWSAVKPIVEALGDIKIIKPHELRNNIYLIPGDIKLAEFEEDLPTLWGDCYQSKIKGYRGVSALSSLINQIAINKNIDFIFYDSGPNIGALNKAVLLDCDFYIIPAAYDTFSIRAIKTLGHTLKDWIQSWKTLESLAPSNMYILSGKPVFIGYIPQRFKTYGGVVTQDFAELIPALEKQIKSEIAVQLSRLNPELVYQYDSNFSLGSVKDFGQAASKSQVSGLALWEVNGNDKIKETFTKIAEKLLKRIKKYKSSL